MKYQVAIQLGILFGLSFCFFCGESKLTITVATFNIRYGTAEDGENHWELRKQILFDCIRSIQADIIGTQEGLPFQLEAIQTTFPHLAWFGLGRYHQVTTERSHENLSGEHCAIFYDPSKFVLDRQSTFWLSDHPDSPGSMTWKNGLPRIVTWGLFRDKSTNQSFAVFNTHFHWGEPFVTNGIKLLHEKIEQIAGHLPVILLGDFNLNITTEGYTSLTTPTEKSLYFQDVWKTLELAEENAGTSHNFSGNQEDRIDWILTTPEITPLQAEKVTFQQNGRYPSDHFPVVSKLQIQ